mgnify:CR=1 FL=1
MELCFMGLCFWINSPMTESYILNMLNKIIWVWRRQNERRYREMWDSQEEDQSNEDTVDGR